MVLVYVEPWNTIFWNYIYVEFRTFYAYYM
jgi:hypothetical protein